MLEYEVAPPIGIFSKVSQTDISTTTTLPLALPAAQSPPSPGVIRKGTIVSEAVAQVGDHVLTSREVIASGIVEKATDEKLPTANSTKKIDRSSWVMKEGSETFQKHLAQVILEQVIQLEAENFSVGQVSRSNLESFQKHLQEAVSGWEPWAKLEMSQAEVEKMISRKMRAKKITKKGPLIPKNAAISPGR